MGQFRRFGAALAIAAMMAGGAVSLEAAKGGGGGGKKGGDTTQAICDYYMSILTYPYTGDAIFATVSLLYQATCVQ